MKDEEVIQMRRNIADLSLMIAVIVTKPIEDWLEQLNNDEIIASTPNALYSMKVATLKEILQAKKILRAALELKRTIQEVMPEEAKHE